MLNRCLAPLLQYPHDAVHIVTASSKRLQMFAAKTTKSVRMTGYMILMAWEHADTETTLCQLTKPRCESLIRIQAAGLPAATAEGLFHTP
jgi:hypothetical protein